MLNTTREARLTINKKRLRRGHGMYSMDGNNSPAKYDGALNGTNMTFEGVSKATTTVSVRGERKS